MPQRRAPAGGENPLGFHPFAHLSPILAENQRWAGRIPSCGMPLRGAKTLRVFIPLRIISDVKPIPDSGRGISGGQAEHPLMAAVLPLRARNAAIRGCSACRHDAGLGKDEYVIDK
ncbi:MAG: hypothetical protein LBK61_05125 [Spirochaetaceae bacterium]|jgi:hypothetical protein|nr:hypothetical protein [Spirochaetaceae bacterium]